MVLSVYGFVPSRKSSPVAFFVGGFPADFPINSGNDRAICKLITSISLGFKVMTTLVHGGYKTTPGVKHCTKCKKHASTIRLVKKKNRVCFRMLLLSFTVAFHCSLIHLCQGNSET